MIERIASETTAKSLLELFNFLMPEIGLLLLITAGGLLYLAAFVLFSWFEKKKKPKQQSQSHGLQLKIISFFLILFGFFIHLNFESNLNTENVLVEIDDLLYSTQQILKTKKEFCFFENSSELDFLKNVSS